VRDYIYVDDVVAALESAMIDQSHVRVFNIGSGRGRSLLEVIGAIEKVLSTKIKINYKQSRRFDVSISVLSIERARNILKWTPSISFENGLQRTCNWWESIKK
jgi:UDP-glucose 4-epimerase